MVAGVVFLFVYIFKEEKWGWIVLSLVSLSILAGLFTYWHSWYLDWVEENYEESKLSIIKKMTKQKNWHE
jgi:hypothetical protein